MKKNFENKKYVLTASRVRVLVCQRLKMYYFYSTQQTEWEQFQNDLLMTVRVANDLKTEAQGELQRLVLENKQLRDKIKLLETKIQTLTSKKLFLLYAIFLSVLGSV